MLSGKSHENVIQGHFVTFGLGAKNLTEQENCMPLAPTSVYGEGVYGNPTNTAMVEGFHALTHARVARVDPTM